ncbi:MAG: manganese efflux pump [Rhodospirillaceae bacterium]|nr:manganese efflux pump [Rhodospirillaceae bacterium]
MFSIFAMAFSLSTDSFVVALAKGAALTRANWRVAIKTGLIFGLVQMVTPWLGWLLGNAASGFVEAIDHWIAFILLGAVGIKMIWEGYYHQLEREKSPKDSWMILVLAAIATSIDALVVGVTLAFLETDILMSAAVIGGITFFMVTIGMMIGRYIGATVGRAAEVLGGVTLIGMGTHILLTHLAII